MRVAEQPTSSVVSGHLEKPSRNNRKVSNFKDFVGLAREQGCQSRESLGGSDGARGYMAAERARVRAGVPGDASPELGVRARAGEVLADGRRPSPDGCEGHGDGGSLRGGEGREDDGGADFVLDPLSRSLAEFVPDGGLASSASAAGGAHAAHAAFLGHVQRLLKRVSIGGDGQKGTARIEVGSGELSGAVILVHAEAGEVVVDVELPPGADEAEWRARLERRLSGRGVEVRELNVR